MSMKNDFPKTRKPSTFPYNHEHVSDISVSDACTRRDVCCVLLPRRRLRVPILSPAETLIAMWRDVAETRDQSPSGAVTAGGAQPQTFAQYWLQLYFVLELPVFISG